MSFFFAEPPLNPGLSVSAGADLRSFIFSITPPTPSECVENYTITAPGVNIIVLSDDINRQIMSSPDFDLCADTFDFTVTAVTNGGNRATSPPVLIPDDIDFSGRVDK